MTSIKTKFRPSSVEGKEGSIYFQIIHNRVVRQLNTVYRIFASEWDEEAETIIILSSENAKIAKFLYTSIKDIYQSDCRIEYAQKTNLKKNMTMSK